MPEKLPGYYKIGTLNQQITWSIWHGICLNSPLHVYIKFRSRLRYNSFWLFFFAESKLTIVVFTSFISSGTIGVHFNKIRHGRLKVLMLHRVRHFFSTWKYVSIRGHIKIIRLYIKCQLSNCIVYVGKCKKYLQALLKIKLGFHRPSSWQTMKGSYCSMATRPWEQQGAVYSIDS